MPAAPKNGDDSGMMEYYDFAAAHFPALYDLEMHHWAEAMALQPAAECAPHIADHHLLGADDWRSAQRAMLTQHDTAARKFDEAQDAVRKSKYAYMSRWP